MKTTILFLMACLCARADTNSTSHTKIEEYAFKAGVITGYGYTAYGWSTNSGAPESREKGDLLMQECWSDFTNHAIKTTPHTGTKAILPKLIWITNNITALNTNDGIKWLESPMTLPIYNYHTNGYEAESLWNAYKWTDPTIQIGLRSDGVVVWRKRPEDK